MGTLAVVQGSGGELWYEIVFFVHILCAIVGFGTVFLNGMYGQKALDLRGREGAAISETNFWVSNVAEYFIYAVFVTGLLMALTAEDGTGIEISDPWLSAAMGLFIVSVGISHGLLRPSVKKLNAALAATGDGVDAGAADAEIDALNKRVAAAGAILNVLTVVILYLMIWKPGAGVG